MSINTSLPLKGAHEKQAQPNLYLPLPYYQNQQKRQEAAFLAPWRKTRGPKSTSCRIPALSPVSAASLSKPHIIIKTTNHASRHSSNFASTTQLIARAATAQPYPEPATIESRSTVERKHCPEPGANRDTARMHVETKAVDIR